MQPPSRLLTISLLASLNDAAWTDNGDGTASITGGPLAAGEDVEIDITLTAGSATGDFVNWAEISSDDGNDLSLIHISEPTRPY